MTQLNHRPRRIGAAPGVRPLRPGPRINLAGRGRGVSTTTTTTEAPVEDHVTGDEEPQSEAEATEKVSLFTTIFRNNISKNMLHINIFAFTLFI